MAENPQLTPSGGQMRPIVRKRPKPTTLSRLSKLARQYFKLDKSVSYKDLFALAREIVVISATVSSLFSSTGRAPTAPPQPIDDGTIQVAFGFASIRQTPAKNDPLFIPKNPFLERSMEYAI